MKNKKKKNQTDHWEVVFYHLMANQSFLILSVKFTVLICLLIWIDAVAASVERSQTLYLQAELNNILRALHLRKDSGAEAVQVW